MTGYQPRIPVKVRTARQQHQCENYPRCSVLIEPGEKYEIHAMVPWSDGNESQYWRTFKVHLGGSGIGLGCHEAAAYAEKAARERAR